MPCCEKDRVSWVVDLAIVTTYGDLGLFTEFLGVKDPFVEQNDAGAQRDPNPERAKN